MEIGINFNTIFQLIITTAVGFIGWSLKELYNKSEKRQDATEKDLKELKCIVNENIKDMLKAFVTKDDHYRDINAIEKKVDDIKDILLDMKEDIGRLTGAKERSK